MRDWLRYRKNRKGSLEFFLFLCQHVVGVHDNYLEIASKKRENLLTIMSFCFIGGMTFAGSSFEYIDDSILSKCFLVASLGVWIASFLAALLVNAKSNYYRVLPGRRDGISFLPCIEDRTALRNNRIKPFDADTFFMKRILEYNGHNGYQNDNYDEILKEYHQLTKNMNDIEIMNKNAWLASLVFSSMAQTEAVENKLKIYRWLYLSLWFSLAFLAVAIIIALF